MTTILVIALLLGCYTAACCWWPYTSCSRCLGTGKVRSPSGKAWRQCRRCKGTGRKVRVGRRVWDWASR